MGNRHSTAIVAAIATLLAATPLTAVFATPTWLFYAATAVAIVAGAATAARALHAPVGLQVLAAVAALFFLLIMIFPSGGELARFIPTRETFEHFNSLFNDAGREIRVGVPPVPDSDPLLLLSTAGIGLMAVLIDLCAVGLRRPALAGLPMLALYSVPVAVLTKSVSFITFSLAAIGFMWLLVHDSVDRVRRFGRRFSGTGRDVEIWEPSPLSAAGRRLGVVGIIVAIVLPLGLPSMTSALGGRNGSGTGGQGGSGNGGAVPATVDMNALLKDNLTRPDTFDMVQVQTNDPNPYYLRIGTADQISAAGFASQIPTSGTPVDRPLTGRQPVTTSEGPYHASVKILNLDLGFAPVFQRLQSIGGLDGNWSLDPATDDVFSSRNTIDGASYTFEYRRQTYSPATLRTAGVIGTDLGERLYTTVPRYNQITDLVTSLTVGKTTEYDIVRAVYDYFSPENGFRYALQTVPGHSGSDIVDFLLNKQGFCEQYAAAMAWLVRAAGYPSRVAFGFTRGNGSNDGVYTLTNLNLHAWTEVYFPGFGWVPFDATPGYAVTGSTRTEWAPGPNQGDNGGTGVTPSVGTSANPGAGGGDTGPEPENTDSPKAPNTKATPLSGWYIVLAVVLIAVFLVLYVPGAYRRALRRRRQARSGGVITLTPAPPGQADVVTDPAAMSQAQRDAHDAWAELLDTMIDYGVLVDPSETPRATAGRLARTDAFDPSGHPVSVVLAQAEERARYAPTPMRPTNLDDAVRMARQAFAERATRAQRISATLFPRSVLMRWRLGWYGFVATTTRRAGKVRDAVLLVNLRDRRTRRK